MGVGGRGGGGLEVGVGYGVVGAMLGMLLPYYRDGWSEKGMPATARCL